MYHPNSDPAEPPRTAFTPTAGSPLNATSLSGNKRADTVVVGGGIAGASAALHLAENGVSVVLLEANSIGWGASGRNAGHVAPASKLSLEEAVRRYGPVHGPRFNDACEAGPDLVFNLVARHGFNADMKRGGILVAAHSPAAVAELSERAHKMQGEGKPARFLTRPEAAEAIGSSLYLGAFYDERGGSINSLAYVRGLIRAAMGHGAHVHENSRVISVRRERAGWQVTTADGSVTTERVIICTNAYTDGLWRGLQNSIVPARSYHVATYPLPPETARTILPGAAAMTDRRRLLIGIRMTQDGRMQFNAFGEPVGPDRGIEVDRSIARMEEIFPQARPIRIDPQFRWSGWMAMSLAGTWKMHQLAPGVTAALGCNGRGVAMGTIFGRDLARYALGAPEENLTIPFEPLHAMPFRFVHPFVARIVARRKDRKDIREMEQLRSNHA